MEDLSTSQPLIDLIDHPGTKNLTYTGRSNAILIGNALNNVITGGAQNDILEGGGGSDKLIGGAGADLLIAYYTYEDSDIGTEDELLLSAFEREKKVSLDVLYGGKGNDFYLLDRLVNTPAIVEYRGEGIDTILGDLAEAYTLPDHVENYINDLSISNNGIYQYVTVTGNSLANIIKTSADWSAFSGDLSWIPNAAATLLTSVDADFVAAEKFFGLGSNDTLVSGAGGDYLSGGEGNDRLTGGSGADQFVFDVAPNRRTNVDTITDFAARSDKLVFDMAVFASLAGGISTDNLAINAQGKAIDANDYLVFNSRSQTLFYDLDGSGKGAAVPVALLSGVRALSPSDFLVQ